MAGQQFHQDADLPYSNYITVKYDSDGEMVWLARDDNHADLVDLAVDVAGNVYVTGRVSSPPSAR